MVQDDSLDFSQQNVFFLFRVCAILLFLRNFIFPSEEIFIIFFHSFSRYCILTHHIVSWKKEFSSWNRFNEVAFFSGSGKSICWSWKFIFDRWFVTFFQFATKPIQSQSFITWVCHNFELRLLSGIVELSKFDLFWRPIIKFIFAPFC